MEIKIKGIQKDNKQNICYICRNQGENGIMIGKSLICVECKSKIICADMKSSKYNFYKNKIKEVFLNLDV
ncbi:MAG: sigma factor G inhibitor Gin [Clostridium sp.]